MSKPNKMDREAKQKTIKKLTKKLIKKEYKELISMAENEIREWKLFIKLLKK